MRISDWSSDVCSSDLELGFVIESPTLAADVSNAFLTDIPANAYEVVLAEDGRLNWLERTPDGVGVHTDEPGTNGWQRAAIRSEEHTSELQSLMRISYAVFRLKKNNQNNKKTMSR